MESSNIVECNIFDPKAGNMRIRACVKVEAAGDVFKDSSTVLSVVSNQFSIELPADIIEQIIRNSKYVPTTEVID